MIIAQLTLANPWWCLTLPLILVLAFLIKRTGTESSITYSSLSVLKTLAQSAKKRPIGLHLTCLLAALFFGIIACARPQLLKSYENDKQNGIDIVIALDLSYSMIIDDFFPNDDRSKKPIIRLEAAKRVLKKFITTRINDRIGIVAFSGRPYTLSPITLDHSWLHNRLEAVNIGDIKEQGTAIGSAIAASSSRLTERNSKSKVIILITDGANNTGKLDPVEAAKLSSELNVKIYTIAIGTEEGRVPSTIQSYPKQEFDEPTLKEIASTTGGEFYRARSISDLKDTFNTINTLEKTKIETTKTTIAKELFHWFAGCSALLAFTSLLFRVLLPVPIP